ncbi:MFS transporter family glucose-6-phosphate receptor UhpC, partial [Escherichia coli]|nr:MFS transporter family glucose-6-phosphate receptor UhpC [Escherichia coli]
MLPFLKAPADAPLMTDKHEIDARYRYWRRHILLTIWLGYALFYFTRKSFNAAVPEILANGVLSRSDIGLLATLFYITYGVSKFVSGIVSDRSNARYFMGIGLIATGIINILFGFSTSLWAFAVLWVLNAFFQGWGSPVCARLLTAWYSRTERGGWWALWNTAHNVGGALIPIVMAAAALHYGWRAGMMIAGCMAIVVGIFLCWRLRDRPQALGLPAVGEWRHDALEIAQQQEGAGLTRKEILTKYVLLNPYIWLLSFCYVLVYVVRAAINDWGNLYMSETLGVDLVTANTAVTMFELGGFIGALVAGWGSDKLFNGNRGPMNLIFAAGILLSVGSLWLMPFASYVMQATCFFTIGFFV